MQVNATKYILTTVRCQFLFKIIHVKLYTSIYMVSKKSICNLEYVAQGVEMEFSAHAIRTQAPKMRYERSIDFVVSPLRCTSSSISRRVERCDEYATHISASFKCSSSGRREIVFAAYFVARRCIYIYVLSSVGCFAREEISQLRYKTGLTCNLLLYNFRSPQIDFLGRGCAPLMCFQLKKHTPRLHRLDFIS